MSAQPERRRAVVRITEQMITAMLDLPDGIRVVGVRDDFIAMGVLVMVEGDGLDPVPSGAVTPDLPGYWRWPERGGRPRFVPDPTP